MSETVVHQSEVFYYQLENDILRAQNTIDFETYIFELDQVGGRILTNLKKAARRGVKVRLLVDGFGSPFFSAGELPELMSVKIYHPVPWHFWHWNRSIKRGPWISRFLTFISGLNRRNHRKSVVIDNKIAWVGSFNITEKNWRDSAIRIESDAAKVTEVFEKTWTRKSTLFNQNVDQTVRTTNHVLRDIIKGCQNRLWITTPYFLPNRAVIREIKKAAKRAVDVRLLLPRQNDVPVSRWASWTYYRSLLKSGVKIYEFLPKVLHAKIFIADDWISVGSSNLNHRSLFHDLELDITVQTDAAKKNIVTKFEEDLRQSEPVALTQNPIGLAIKNYFSKLFILFRNWM